MKDSSKRLNDERCHVSVQTRKESPLSINEAIQKYTWKKHHDIFRCITGNLKILPECDQNGLTIDKDKTERTKQHGQYDPARY